MGTPAYMAPEQARGEPAGAGSDLFSLGCVLYRLCTCRLPFEGDSVMAVLTRSVDGQRLPAPRDLNDRIPASLRRTGHAAACTRSRRHGPVSAEVVVKEIRTIERELLAERQKAELSAADASDGRRGVAQRKLRARPSRKRARHNRRRRLEARRRTLVIAAAVLAALAATAVVGFVFAPHRKSKVGIVAAGPTSAPAHDQGAVAPIMTPETEAARTAQPVASPDQLSPQVDRGAVSEPSPAHRSRRTAFQSRDQTWSTSRAGGFPTRRPAGRARRPECGKDRATIHQP